MPFDPDRSVYILEDGRPVPVPASEFSRWASWFETFDRQVAETSIPTGEGVVRVSTIFLGIDSRTLDDASPLLWETLVFGGQADGSGRRYASEAAALAGHGEVVAALAGMMGFGVSDG